MTSDAQADVFAFLARPETYAADTPPPDRVERVDTHISAVFLAGERVLKVKKAVTLPFLDFGTPDARHGFCVRELEVNRRAAPALYRGLVAVTRRPDGGLALDGAGPVVEWAVEMRRFDAAQAFDRMATEGRLDRALAERLAGRVAALHAAAAPRPDHGGRAGLQWVVDNNAASFARFVPGVFAAGAIDALTAGCQAALDRVAALVDSRRAAGLVRQCHGDLHLANICLFENEPTLFDAMEFSEALACVDVLYDLAFLLMDLDQRGLRGLAAVVLNGWVEHTGDLGGLAALPLFLALRAAIRAHVTAAMGDAVRARALADRAAAYLAPPPPRLVAVGGLSGSGKSRLARNLAEFLGPAPGAVVLRSDVIRKRLLGVDPLTTLPPEAYSAEMTERTYAALFAQAQAVLATGHAAVADAVFARPDQRAAIAAVAGAAGVPFAGLWLVAPPEITRDRVDQRRNNASDATAAVVDQQQHYDLGEIDWNKIDASGSREDTLSFARDVLGV